MQGKIRHLAGFIVIVGVLILTLSAQNATSNVTGGKHDLSLFGNSNFQYNSQQPCIFCHTPHGSSYNKIYTTNPNTRTDTGTGNEIIRGQFLWNRALPSRAWTVYSSTTMNHAVPGTPGTLSLMCLSCHDGVGAMNVLINNAGSGFGTNPVSVGIAQNQFGDFALSDPNMGPLNVGDAVITGDTITSGGDNLQNDHPIGFVYNDTLDTGLKPISGMDSRLVSRFGITSNRLECSTCHDPHLTNTGGNMFLVMPNTGSALCLECHNK